MGRGLQAGEGSCRQGAGGCRQGGRVGISMGMQAADRRQHAGAFGLQGVGRRLQLGCNGLQVVTLQAGGCGQGAQARVQGAAGRVCEQGLQAGDRLLQAQSCRQGTREQRGIHGQDCRQGAAGRMRWASAMGEPLAHLKGAQSFSHPLAPPLGLSCPGRVKAAARTGPEMSPAQHLAKDTLLISPSWSEGQRAGRDLRRSHLLLGSWRTGGC